MGALSAFQRSYLEEIMLTDLILNNLANVSGYPLKKKEDKIHTKLFCVLCVWKYMVLLKVDLFYRMFFCFSVRFFNP